MPSTSSPPYHRLLGLLPVGILVAYAGFMLTFAGMPAVWDEPKGLEPTFYVMNTHHFMWADWWVMINGHPPLYYTIRTFLYWVADGQGMMALRFISLLFSVITAAYIYRLSLLLSRSVWIASAVMAVIIIQPMYIAQGVMSMVEMPLSMLMLMTLYYYYKKQISLSGLCALCAAASKETGVIISLALLSISVYEYCKGDRSRAKVKQVMLYTAPLILYICWIVISKVTVGTFFYAYHLAYVGIGWSRLNSLRLALILIFFYQGHFRITLFLFLPVILYGRRFFEAFPTIRSTLPAAGVTFVLMLAYLVCTAIYGRYFLFIYILFLIFSLNIIFITVSRWRRVFMPQAVFLALLIYPVFHPVADNNPNADMDLTIRHLAHCNQMCAAYLKNANLTDRKFWISAPLWMAFRDRRYGYADHPLHLLQPEPAGLDSAEAVVYDPHAENKVPLSDVQAQFDFLDSLSDPPCVVYIYKRKKL